MRVPDPHETPTLTIEQAGEILGLGRSAAYDAARRGELPGVLSFGRRRVVATAVLLKKLGLSNSSKSAQSAESDHVGP